LRELLTGYGPIAGVWFDTPGPITPEQSAMLVNLVHDLQPDCLVNSRIGHGLGDYDTLGDQEIPSLPRPGLWETCDTHNDTWGYAWYDRNFKSSTELATRLARVVSRGGTYLLNVGPDGLGRIPDASARILREVGQWVQAHEDALHGANPTPLGPLPWGECTARDGRLYLHVAQWPAEGRLLVPGLAGSVRAARLDGRELVIDYEPEAIALSLPPHRPDSLLPVVSLDVTGTLAATGERFVLPGCVNALTAPLADRHDCELTTVRWMEKFGDWHHAECLAGWQGADSRATWTFRTLGPLACYLELEYTCPAADDYAEWRLLLDELELGCPLIDPATPSRSAFGGPCPASHLRSASSALSGSHTLTLGPAGEAGLGMRLSDVRLSPL